MGGGVIMLDSRHFDVSNTFKPSMWHQESHLAKNAAKSHIQTVTDPGIEDLATALSAINFFIIWCNGIVD